MNTAPSPLRQTKFKLCFGGPWWLTTKRTALGALIAASGAFAWALIFCGSGMGGEPWYATLVVALYAVAITSWFVLPIGGVLGALMPRLVRGLNGRKAFLRGTVVGIGVGVLAATLTIAFFEWPALSGSAIILDPSAWLQSIRRQFGYFLPTMIPVCAIWVGLWAYRWREPQLHS